MNHNDPTIQALAGLPARPEQHLSADINRQAVAVSELASAISGLQALGPTLDALLDTIKSHIDFDECVIALADRNQRRLQDMRKAGMATSPAPTRTDSATDYMAKADRGGQPVFGITDRQKDSRLRCNFVAAVPVGPGGDVTGAIGIGCDAAQFSKDDIDLLHALANVAGPRISSCLAEERLNRAVLNLENAQNELERTQVDYRSLFECHPSLLFMLNQEGRVLMVNDTACALLQRTEVQIVNQRFETLVPERDRAGFLSHVDDGWNCDTHGAHESALLVPGHANLRVRLSVRRVTVSHGTRAMLIVAEDITESWVLQRRLRYEADHDALTGLMNRNCFERRLQRRLTDLAETSEDLTLLTLDLDHFKEVNDNAGHAAGDELLRRLAECFSSCVRGADIVARMGGDEFAMLLNNCELSNAHRIAESVRSQVDSIQFAWGTNEFRPGVSIGVVTLQAGDTVETALSAGDSACYAAKRAGRNQVRGFSPTDLNVFAQAHDIERARQVQNWIREERFELHHQPIMSASSPDGGPIAFEVLIRCRHEDQLLQPDNLFPADDRLGIAAVVDRWVIKRSIKWLRSQEHVQDNPERVVINLWPRSIADPSLGSEVAQMIRNSGVRPDRIVFEVPLSCISEQSTALHRLCGELGTTGCRFGLDDMGANLMVFDELQGLPFDYVKLARLLTRGISSDPLSFARVSAIVTVAAVESIEVGAKMVDSREDVQTLAECGVDFLQGFELAKPKLITLSDAIPEIDANIDKKLT